MTSSTPSGDRPDEPRPPGDPGVTPPDDGGAHPPAGSPEVPAQPAAPAGPADPTRELPGDPGPVDGPTRELPADDVPPGSDGPTGYVPATAGTPGGGGTPTGNDLPPAAGGPAGGNGAPTGDDVPSGNGVPADEGGPAGDGARPAGGRPAGYDGPGAPGGHAAGSGDGPQATTGPRGADGPQGPGRPAGYGGAPGYDASGGGYEGYGTPGGTGYARGRGSGTPITGYALRHRLVRPRNGRKLAGVCAGMGAATGTDPVLWRVIIAILTLFGGVGALAYALAWVAMPGEGDEAAPIESLIGRGRSRTPAVLTVLLCAVAVGLLFFVFNDGFRFTMLLVSVAGVIAVLMYRRNQQRTGGAPGTTVPPGTRYRGPAADGVPLAGWDQPQAGYQAPFAPHGPYQPGPGGEAGGRPATAASMGTGEIPLTGWNDQVPPPPPPTGRTKRPRERSLLGRLTLLTGCVAVGSLIVLAVVGMPVPPDMYIAAALAVVGGGLVVGAWRGRARWLIIVGCVLALLLPVARFSDSGPSQMDTRPRPPDQGLIWSPTDQGQISPRYHTDIGDATLDLSAVDFTGVTRTIDVDADVGDVTIVLPPDVDTTVRLHKGVGDATVFDQGFDGPRNHTFGATDLGADGEGGGTLTLDVNANVGNVEVSR